MQPEKEPAHPPRNREPDGLPRDLHRSLLESLTDVAVFAVDARGRIASWPPAAERLFGYGARAAVGMPYARLYPDEDDLAAVHLDTVRMTGRHEHEGWRVRQDGKHTWVRVTLTGLDHPDTGGNVAVVMQELLPERNGTPRATDAGFRLLVEGVEDYAIFMLDHQGRVATWNRGAERIKGWRAEEIIGQHFSRFYPADDVADGKPERLLALARARGSVEDEGWRVRKDGRQFFANVLITALRDRDGGLWGYAKVVRDLSERAHTSDFLRSIIDHVLDGIISIDERGTIQSFNLAAERMFGYRAAEVVGRNVRMLMPEPYQGQHDQFLANYLRTGVARIIGSGREVRGRRKDGSTFPIDLAVSEFMLGRRRHFTGLIRDISQRKALEQQLVQSQKMEAVGRLAGGVAHDFNNLLTVVSGYSELLLLELAPGHPHRQAINAIRHASDQAKVLTRQLLAFSRKQFFEPRVVSLNDVVRSAEGMLRRVIGEDVTLTTGLEPELGSTRVDPLQVEQVIMNLAINARDAMPTGGKLRIATGTVTPTEEDRQRHPGLKPGPYARLTVDDTGCGMDAATLARLFEPFFTTKGPGKGTGLGLATVYGIVKQSEGFIDVDSEVGRGTTFHVHFPIVPGQAESRALAEPVLAPRGTETILVAEDEAGVRDIARLALESHGYRALTARDGEEALAIAQEAADEIDLLVTDVVMPEMSGPRLAEKLRAREPGLKVLFLSGYTEDAVLRHGIQQAQVHFLQKPFTPFALAKKVREILDG
jgi:PAS domain S-box-containing protein